MNILLDFCHSHSRTDTFELQKWVLFEKQNASPFKDIILIKKKTILLFQREDWFFKCSLLIQLPSTQYQVLFTLHLYLSHSPKAHFFFFFT
ncbi:hypothetical protein O6P43_022332 [Quillaja saponaria]|uniref:Uncharacterized protein n=1 Tax=Quillaja saponaria TaxID=32244 RepID=A0AAD7PIB4_QUISA|nr:hypothetical protein O6P43_022332 [Quillaja saponaria]